MRLGTRGRRSLGKELTKSSSQLGQIILFSGRCVVFHADKVTVVKKELRESLTFGVIDEVSA